MMKNYLLRNSYQKWNISSDFNLEQSVLSDDLIQHNDIIYVLAQEVFSNITTQHFH